ncbi:MAG: tetratricopeptide repeat protein [Chloroflexi bacterium]|jgi:hypothetical protein|nr:tetratricopeptide repeat protein [Chloroflexota bacterium]
MRKRFLILALLAIPLFCLLAVIVYNLPPVHSRLAWRVQSLITQIRYTINPPEQVVFVPQEGSARDDFNARVEAIVQATLAAAFPTVTPTPLQTEETGPVPTATPTPQPTPLPGQMMLSGIRHEYQQMNNCGPATLAMALSYWGWSGDQTVTRAYLRPNHNRVDDKNVMPEEMVAYVETQTGMKALSRVGGDLTVLKGLLAAGFPVIVEKGFQPHGEAWMGHYALFNGYDDQSGRFTTQDSYVGPNVEVTYAEMESTWWRDFNYVFVVAYPPEREAEVLSILGPLADETAAYRLAAERARQEIAVLNGRDLFFAWYNLGSSLVGLQEYPAAAEAYDQAFAVYATLPEADRPWRVLWYQTGPYAAYYHTGRYQDVITLGNQTLDTVGGPILEESFYWMGLAREATGDLEKAIYDFQKAVEINPDSTPARQELVRLGVAMP